LLGRGPPCRSAGRGDGAGHAPDLASGARVGNRSGGSEVVRVLIDGGLVPPQVDFRTALLLPSTVCPQRTCRRGRCGDLVRRQRGTPAPHPEGPAVWGCCSGRRGRIPPEEPVHSRLPHSLDGRIKLSTNDFVQAPEPPAERAA